MGRQGDKGDGEREGVEGVERTPVVLTPNSQLPTPNSGGTNW